MEFTQEQVKAMAERAATVLATILLAKMVRMGWLSDSDSAALLPFLILLPSLAYAWWVNRNKALVKAVANTLDDEGKKQIVLTSATVAASLPEQNVISNEAAKVVSAAGPGAPLTQT